MCCEDACEHTVQEPFVLAGDTAVDCLNGRFLPMNLGVIEAGLKISQVVYYSSSGKGAATHADLNLLLPWTSNSVPVSSP